MWKILTGIWLDLAQYWIDPFPLQRWFLTFIESCNLTKVARSISYIPTSQNKNATRDVFGLSLFLLKLKTETENTVAK